MQTAVFVGLLHALFDAFIGFIYANVPPFRWRWSVKEMPDLSGRVAIVTGGNLGIGFVTCLELARRGAKVYLASRTESRAKSAIEEIKQLVPDAQLGFIHFDLTILSSAKAAAEEFMSKESRLDMLINNAGVMGTRYELSPDGIEVQACNATGHFALTSHLLPILKRTASSVSDAHVRIVNVSSTAHITATDPDLSSLEGINRPNDWPMGRYGHSKLNNILLTNELQKRLSDSNIYCLSVHPGVVASQLTRGIVSNSIANLYAEFGSYIIARPSEGALTQLYAATSPEIESKRLRAAYLVPYGQVGRKSFLAEDHEGKLGRQFWHLCEKLMQEAENKQK
ncbi:hypothetical protein, variant [Puccinia triticina 1-1 BBBD Race 1]|uniref:Uncharacterized protein n=2 Tax=Puccinia triticina TaxID=208348 RepID=A0A180G7P2_PUCT1|nr:uncharacterized protein PtA15_1A630 [Puccinia triticina]OAV88717.1 hypothetical protein PTTG_01892 [Puccinia triticina 1-1 BBBD Race 1]OAV88718.1 hypothetical protein, variant [Puccinia triticina 1-1 BBBD Race 1]WAQ81290.1 hypothetical protein PtA15_1A630 [Puccinia triticina]